VLEQGGEDKTTDYLWFLILNHDTFFTDSIKTICPYTVNIYIYIYTVLFYIFAIHKSNFLIFRYKRKK